MVHAISIGISLLDTHVRCILLFIHSFFDVGIPDGYYALHLHEATDREAFFRLFSLNRDYMFQRRHVERQGDISQVDASYCCTMCT